MLIPLIFGIQLWLICRKKKYLNLTLTCMIIVIALGSPLLETDNDSCLYGIRYKKNWIFLKKMESKGWIYKIESGQEKPTYLQAGFKLSSLENGHLPLKIIPNKGSASSGSYLFRINGKTMLVLNHYFKGRIPANKIKIDAILLQDAGEKSLIRALEFFSPAEIWLDWNASRCEKLHGKLPDHPLIRNFRDKKLIRIEYSGGRDLKAADPESADSRTS
jgi:hypothetical protein